MKRLVTSLFIAAIACSAALQAEDFVAPAPTPAPIPERPTDDRRPIGFQGIFSQIFRVFQPLQLINPFAPSYYGTGEQNVSPQADPNEPKPPYFESEGLVVFGVEW